MYLHHSATFYFSFCILFFPKRNKIYVKLMTEANYAKKKKKENVYKMNPNLTNNHKKKSIRNWLHQKFMLVLTRSSR